MASTPEKRDNWFRRLQRNRYLFFIRNGAWRSKVLRWAVRVLRTLFLLVRFDRFEIAVRAGVEDPMVTGTIAGFHRAALYGLPMKRPYLIRYEPVFMRNCFECSGGFRVGTSLWRLLTPAAVAVFTFPALSTLWLGWRRYRVGKQRARSEAP